MVGCMNVKPDRLGVIVTTAAISRWSYNASMQAPLINIYSISVPKEITRVVKIRAHRLTDGDIITITDYTNIEILNENDSEIIIKIKK